MSARASASGGVLNTDDITEGTLGTFTNTSVRRYLRTIEGKYLGTEGIICVWLTRIGTCRPAAAETVRLFSTHDDPHLRCTVHFA